MISAASIPVYKRFVERRDKAIESILHNAQAKQSDVFRLFLTNVLEIVSHHYQDASFVTSRITSQSSFFVPRFVMIVRQMRKATYLIATRSEAEALALAGVKGAKAVANKQDIREVEDWESAAGGSLHARLQLYLARIAREVGDAVQLSTVLGETREETLERALAVLPKGRSVTRPKRVLKPIAEADKKPTSILSVGYISDDDWADAVDEYMAEYVPIYRGPEDVIDIATVKKTSDRYDEWYAWEFEQDLTQEFVQSVRDGQIDAANANGIDEFVWVAIIDNKTDECCIWRDGLTTAEIQTELSRGGHKNDECRAFAPPAHFQCRCTLAPVLAKADIEPPVSNAPEFDEWLNAA